MQVNIDGGTNNTWEEHNRRKPGSGRWAWVAIEDGREVSRGRGLNGDTSNEAELWAAIGALVWASREGHRGLTLVTDSQLVERWLTRRMPSGRYPQLRQMATEARRLMTECDATVRWVRREENRAAHLATSGKVA